MNIPVGLNPQRLAQQFGRAYSPPGVGGAGAGGVQNGAGGAGAAAGGPTFKDTLERALGEVSATQDSAAEQMSAFMRGEQVELHQVMAAAEEAGIALEMLVEIRNKFTEAYRTVINMQS